MSEYTINRSDAEPEKRTWQGGHFYVKKDGIGCALFLFDYPESTSHLYCDEAEVLAAAKSFMAIDDLVAAVNGLKTILEISVAGKDGLQYANLETRQGTFVRVVEALQDAESALEKAGVK
jgi:hypothetical protein